MKYFILLLLAFVLPANASQLNKVDEKPFDVVGVGSTHQAALENAFRKAIEYKIGVILVTNIAAEDNKIVRDEIINYSSGYVKSYKILNQNFDGRQHIVTVTVEVASSKIANRILSNSKDGSNVNGNNLSAQATTHLQTTRNASRLLSTVLEDYPKKAFNIEINDQKLVSVSSDKVSYITYFKFSWNKNWLAALNEVMTRTRDGDVKTKQTLLAVVLENNQNKFFTLNNLLVHYFDDNDITKNLRKRLFQNRPYIKLTYLSGSKVLDYGCMAPHMDRIFYNYEDTYNNVSSMKFNTFKVTNEHIGINMHKSDKTLKEITSVDLEVVNEKECD